MLLNRLLLLIGFLICCTSLDSLAAPNEEAMCILLNQQVAQFKSAPRSNQYRSAKRAYDRKCNQPKKIKKPKASSSLVKSDTSQNKVEALKPKQTQTSKSTDSGVTEQAKTEDPKVRYEIALPDNKAENQTKEVLKTERISGTKENARYEIVIPDKKAEPELQTKQASKIKANNQTVKKTPQINQISSNETSLMSLLLIPTILLIVICCGAAFIIFYVKPRSEKIKIQMQEMQTRAAKVKTGLSQKAIAAKKEITQKAEAAKKRKNNQLDLDHYHSFKHISIPQKNGEVVKVDRVTISPYGVFVVVSQKESGGIFGGMNAGQWTHKTQNADETFENPVQKANRLAFSVGKLLNINEGGLPVVLFNDLAVFKSPMPGNVMHRKQLNAYILGFKELMYSDEEFTGFLSILNNLVSSEREKSEKQQFTQNTPSYLQQEAPQTVAPEVTQSVDNSDIENKLDKVEIPKADGADTASLTEHPPSKLNSVKAEKEIPVQDDIEKEEPITSSKDPNDDIPSLDEFLSTFDIKDTKQEASEKDELALKNGGDKELLGSVPHDLVESSDNSHKPSSNVNEDREEEIPSLDDFLSTFDITEDKDNFTHSNDIKELEEKSKEVPEPETALKDDRIKSVNDNIDGFESNEAQDDRSKLKSDNILKFEAINSAGTEENQLSIDGSLIADLVSNEVEAQTNNTENLQNDENATMDLEIADPEPDQQKDSVDAEISKQDDKPKSLFSNLSLDDSWQPSSSESIVYEGNEDEVTQDVKSTSSNTKNE